MSRTYRKSYMQISSYRFDDYEYYVKSKRDGQVNESTCNSLYKEWTNKRIRRNDKKVVDMIKKGVYTPEDDYEFYTKQHGKFFAWCIW